MIDTILEDGLDAIAESTSLIAVSGKDAYVGGGSS
jgi:hypothetical protein